MVTEYGSDVDKAKKASKKEVTTAINTLANSEALPVYFEDAGEIVEEFPLAKSLSEGQTIVAMNNEDAAVMLLLM